MKRALILLSLFVMPVLAKLQVEITEGNVQPIPIAVVPFKGDTPHAEDIARQMGEVIQQDLASTGLFRFLDPHSFIQQDVHIDLPPRFGDWRLLKVQALLNGFISMIDENTLKVRYRFWDIYAGESAGEQSLQTQVKYWRRIAHLIADQIYRTLTGEVGYFDTRIVYVTEEATGIQQKKRLAIMDQDGANHKFLTSGRYIVLTPRFSPSLQKIAYLSYEHKMPKVFILDLETGRHELVGKFPGMTFAPRFSPDGKRIVMSQAIDGNSDIYMMDLSSRMVKRLTKTAAINTSPSFSPTGTHITFNSDRGGAKQIYIMTADGKDIKRISFGGGVYSTPVWSPRGDYIAFTKTQGGQFYIGLMKTDGSGERLLSTGFIVESPTWAPNGRTLIYTKQEKSCKDKRGVARLYAIDITGGNERLIKTPQDASDPAWSPTLPTS